MQLEFPSECSPVAGARPWRARLRPRPPDSALGAAESEKDDVAPGRGGGAETSCLRAAEPPQEEQHVPGPDARLGGRLRRELRSGGSRRSPGGAAGALRAAAHPADRLGRAGPAAGRAAAAAREPLLRAGAEPARPARVLVAHGLERERLLPSRACAHRRRQLRAGPRAQVRVGHRLVAARPRGLVLRQQAADEVRHGGVDCFGDAEALAADLRLAVEREGPRGQAVHHDAQCPHVHLGAVVPVEELWWGEPLGAHQSAQPLAVTLQPARRAEVCQHDPARRVTDVGAV
mmetsp:Transcript_103247/g.272881  ORF Transcript_103247/g.272881 Transcript_103247/m.272881 type:complete len:289 (+) Transcript_103247:40-906(+)